MIKKLKNIDPMVTSFAIAVTLSVAANVAAVIIAKKIEKPEN